MAIEIQSPPRCDANASGRAATDWGETFLPCNTRVGLRSFTDRQGVQRFYCAALGHDTNVARRFGRYVSEFDGDGLSESKRAAELAREDAFVNGRLTFKEPER